MTDNLYLIGKDTGFQCSFRYRTVGSRSDVEPEIWVPFFLGVFGLCFWVSRGKRAGPGNRREQVWELGGDLGGKLGGKYRFCFGQTRLGGTIMVFFAIAMSSILIFLARPARLAQPPER